MAKTRSATVCLLLTLSLTLFVGHVHAWFGSITFFDEINWKGSEFKYGISVTNRCYNLNCLKGHTASIKWEGIKSTGSIDDSGHSYLAFYTETKCQGEPHWWHVSADQPSNLEIDGISKNISSFMVWETSKEDTNGIFTPQCTWGAIN